MVVDPVHIPAYRLCYVLLSRPGIYGPAASAEKGGWAHPEKRTCSIAIQTVNRPEELNNPEMHRQERLFSLISALSESPITSCNETRVLTNGQATFEAMLAAIREAKHHIHMEFYILRDDGIGTIFQQALLARAKEGVKVRSWPTALAASSCAANICGRSRKRAWNFTGSCRCRFRFPPPPQLPQSSEAAYRRRPDQVCRRN